MVRSNAGFTLVEILIAVVLLEVGLLAVLGTSILARRVLTRAEIVERGAAEVERTYDSLSQGWSSGSDGRTGPSGWVRWEVGERGTVRVDFGLQADSPLVRVEGLLPAKASRP
ncbi:MAG: prepilin-type N-terminal cleavage/methylation domain-containing protein [Gemmatimonadota bacterium]|jgi:type II secretory pathway pseudopilin PulG